MNREKIEEILREVTSKIISQQSQAVIIYEDDDNINTMQFATYNNAMYFVTAHIINQFNISKRMGTEKQYLESIEFTIKNLKDELK